jgi:type IX secretion system PorP/SprF family membrane protein
MKKSILIIFSLIMSLCGNAQQDAMFTHYSFNTLAVNPGYAGSREALTVTGLHRSQWVFFPGAPMSQTITMHGPISNDKMGLGFSLLGDQLGPTRMIGVNLDWAYKLRVGEKGKLSFGIKGGLNFQTSRLASEVNTIEVADNAFQNDIQSELLPNFGFGLYYANPKFYVGVSVPRLLQNDFLNSTVSNFASNQQRHYFFIAGTVFPINESETIKLKPTTFVKLTNGAPLQFDLTALFYFHDKYWVGPMYRLSDAVGVLAGLNITNQFALGYSFDWSFGNKTGVYNGGSHELVLRYDFIFKDKGSIISPRYF